MSKSALTYVQPAYPFILVREYSPELEKDEISVAKGLDDLLLVEVVQAPSRLFVPYPRGTDRKIFYSGDILYVSRYASPNKTTMGYYFVNYDDVLGYIEKPKK